VHYPGQFGAQKRMLRHTPARSGASNETVLRSQPVSNVVKKNLLGLWVGQVEFAAVCSRQNGHA